jgi:hypothetical protein
MISASATARPRDALLAASRPPPSAGSSLSYRASTKATIDAKPIRPTTTIAINKTRIIPTAKPSKPAHNTQNAQSLNRLGASLSGSGLMQPQRLCGRVWRRHDGRQWIYKPFVEFENPDDQ